MKQINQTVWFEDQTCRIQQGRVVREEREGHAVFYVCACRGGGHIRLTETRLFNTAQQASRHADNRHQRRLRQFLKQIRSPWHLAQFLLQHDIHSAYADPDARKAALIRAKDYHMSIPDERRTS